MDAVRDSKRSKVEYLHRYILLNSIIIMIKIKYLIRIIIKNIHYIKEIRIIRSYHLYINLYRNSIYV